MRLALAPLLLLTACALGPDYAAAPVPPAASAPFTASPVATTAATPDAWWRLYDDPVLDDLIAQAFAANTDIRVATANLRRARAELNEAQPILKRRKSFASFASPLAAFCCFETISKIVLSGIMSGSEDCLVAFPSLLQPFPSSFVHPWVNSSRSWKSRRSLFCFPAASCGELLDGIATTAESARRE